MKKTDEENYLELNKTSWNKRTEVHYDSAFYDNATFVNGRTSLNAIELAFLGDMKGKKVLHLQCHFGQDSISLARMGAMVTAVDLSDKAIEKGKQLAAECGVNVHFIECDVYQLPEILSETFDFIFTSYGTIGWLPDMDRWAAVIDHFLAPGGRFLLVEFHPALWMFDDDFTHVKYGYFNSASIVEETTGTYTDPSHEMINKYVTWNHPLSDVISSLLNVGLHVISFREYDYSPYNCFNKAKEVRPGAFQVEGMEGKLPIVYALEMSKGS